VEPTILFGRDAELSVVGEALRDGRPMAIVGEAGIGKTSLVRAAAQRAGVELREGGALETLSWVPYLALRRAVGEGLSGDTTSVAIEVEHRLGPQVLFIDDLQWTDVGTREVLGLLASRIALVATIRAPGADPESLLGPIGAEVLRLGAVDGEAAAAILRQARPSINPGAAEALVAQAGGNPLLLEELALRGRPTSSLTRALTARLDALTDAGREAFALLAVAGHGLPVSALGPGAEELPTAGVAVLTEIGATELAPRHALLAEAMLATLAPLELAAIHDRLAGLVDDPGERAYHLAGAGRRQEALAAAQVRADEAVTPPDRAAFLELAALMTDGPDSARARIVASRALIGQSDGAGRVIALLEPVDAGTAEGRVEREALLAKAYFDAGDLPASRAAYRRGLELDTLAPSAASDGLAAGFAAFAINVDGDLATGQRIIAEAIASGRGQALVVATDAAIRGFDGADTTDALHVAYRRLLDDSSNPGQAFGTARNLGYVALISRGVEASHACLGEAIADFDAADLQGRADDLRVDDVQVLLFAGRLFEALTLADELLERPLARRPRQWIVSVRAKVLAALGETDAAAETLAVAESSATMDYQGIGGILEARIEAESWAGRPEAVLAAFDAHGEVPSPSRSNRLMPLLEAQWARLETGLDPGEALPPQPWTMMHAASRESEGIVALHVGDSQLAAAALSDAAGLWAPFHVGRELTCRLAEGEALRRAGSPDAEAVLRRVLVRAEGLGYAPLAARARRALRLTGIRVAPPPRETGIRRLAQMTSREREALQLVGRGLTTPQIARRMGLGRGTVDQILGSATAKIGAASRIQAAALLAGGPDARVRTRQAAVLTEEDAGRVVLEALGGASLAVEPGTDPELVDRIQGDLRRLGRLDAVSLEPDERRPELGSDATALLGLLAAGKSLGEAAGSLHLSRRTADRRLAEARAALGVATSAEALLAFQRRR